LTKITASSQILDCEAEETEKEEVDHFVSPPTNDPMYLDIFVKLLKSRKNNFVIATLLATIPGIIHFVVFVLTFGNVGERSYLWFNYIFLSLTIGSLYMYVRNTVLEQQLHHNKMFLAEVKRGFSMALYIFLVVIAIVAAINRNQFIRLIRTALEVPYLFAIAVLLYLLYAALRQCYEDIKNKERNMTLYELFPWLPIVFWGMWIGNTSFIRSVVFELRMTIYIMIIGFAYICVTALLYNKARVATSSKLFAINARSIITLIIFVLTTALHFFAVRQDYPHSFVVLIVMVPLCLLTYKIYNRRPE